MEQNSLTCTETVYENRNAVSVVYHTPGRAAVHEPLKVERCDVVHPVRPDSYNTLFGFSLRFSMSRGSCYRCIGSSGWMGGFIQLLMSPKWKSWFRAMPAGEATVPTASDRSEPSLWEVLLMLAMMFVLHLWTVCRVGSFWDLVAARGDNGPYLGIVAIIRSWHFSGGEGPWHFWGFPWVIAGISKLFSIPELTALVLISMLASLAVCILVHRLFGGWVAAVFIFINYEWIILSLVGSGRSVSNGER